MCAACVGNNVYKSQILYHISSNADNWIEAKRRYSDVDGSSENHVLYFFVECAITGHRMNNNDIPVPN